MPEHFFINYFTCYPKLIESDKVVIWSKNTTLPTVHIFKENQFILVLYADLFIHACQLHNVWFDIITFSREREILNSALKC